MLRPRDYFKSHSYIRYPNRFQFKLYCNVHPKENSSLLLGTLQKNSSENSNKVVRTNHEQN